MSESFVVNGVDVQQLSDDQLYEKLTSFGIDVGPVVESTRRVYQRKLVKLMRGDVEAHSESDGAYDDVEEEEEFIPPTPPDSPSNYSDVRQRVVPNVESVRSPASVQFEVSSLHSDTKYSSVVRESPSARPPIRGFASTSKFDPRDLVSQVEEPIEEPTKQTQGMSWVTKLFIILVISALAYLVYCSIESNPVPQIPDKPVTRTVVNN